MKEINIDKIVDYMRSQAPDWLNKYEDYLDQLIADRKITFKESKDLWDEAIRLNTITELKSKTNMNY